MVPLKIVFTIMDGMKKEGVNLLVGLGFLEFSTHLFLPLLSEKSNSLIGFIFVPFVPFLISFPKNLRLSSVTL